MNAMLGIRKYGVGAGEDSFGSVTPGF
jgi:hypothetical protein